MAVFLNKKERVIDLKLTNYGHYLFSIGSFKPEYYAFFDDNIVYDSAYIGISESQNYTIKRIKEDTQYIESLVLFADAEKEVKKASSELVNFFDVDITPTRKIPRKDIFKFDQAIGDAYLDGPGLDHAPAWKIVVFNGKINSVSERDEENNLEIPQISVTADYSSRVISNNVDYSPENLSNLVDVTPAFADGISIGTQADKFLFYIEELNTETLTDNFDIEIFEIMTGSTTASLDRKFFQTEKEQIVNGMMVAERPFDNIYSDIPSSSVEYYFDMATDYEIEEEEACKAAMEFNKNSYYIDLDFECDVNEQDSVYFDIYGSRVEPEICLD